MKRNCHTAEQIIRNLRTTEQLLNQEQTVADICRALAVSAANCHRWQQLYGGRKATETKRLKELEQENARLKACCPTLRSTRPSSSRKLLQSKRSWPGAMGNGANDARFSQADFMSLGAQDRFRHCRLELLRRLYSATIQTSGKQSFRLKVFTS